MGISKDVIQKIIAKKIEKIEKEIKETPYHKGTEHHIGMLKARLAVMKQRLGERNVKPGGHGGKDDFAVRKTGDASCLFLGAPSVGKSSLLNVLAATKSATGNYAFTTRQVIPGMMFYGGAQIQLFDAPGILPQGNLDYGQGRRILAAARAADLLVIIADVNNPQSLFEIKNKAWQAGIRINKQPLKLRAVSRRGSDLEIGGNLGRFKADYLQRLAWTLGMRGRKIILYDPPETIDDFLDAISGSKAYLPAIFAINKIDLLSEKQKNRLRKQLAVIDPPPILISAYRQQGLEKLRKAIWRGLRLIKFSLIDRRRGYQTVIIARQGKILRDIIKRPAREMARQPIIEVSGPGAKFQSQQVGWEYLPHEGDIVSLR